MPANQQTRDLDTNENFIVRDGSESIHHLIFLHLALGVLLQSLHRVSEHDSVPIQTTVLRLWRLRILILENFELAPIETQELQWIRNIQNTFDSRDRESHANQGVVVSIWDGGGIPLEREGGLAPVIGIEIQPVVPSEHKAKITERRT